MVITGDQNWSLKAVPNRHTNVSKKSFLLKVNFVPNTKPHTLKNMLQKHTHTILSILFDIHWIRYNC